jgi:hypothetical protein
MSIISTVLIWDLYWVSSTTKSFSVSMKSSTHCWFEHYADFRLGDSFETVAKMELPKFSGAHHHYQNFVLWFPLPERFKFPKFDLMPAAWWRVLFCCYSNTWRSILFSSSLIFFFKSSIKSSIV